MKRTNASIMWRRLDAPGHDAARLRPSDNGWRLEGSAVFIDECGPCRLDYVVQCDADWRTLSGRVNGWIGERNVVLEIVSQHGRWTVNGVEYPAAAGCIDLDLNFTPATNLLSLRRLALGVGAEVGVSVAWLRFPELTLEPLPQHYRRTGPETYWYDSDHGDFTAELRVDGEGFVTDYPPLWTQEDGGDARDNESRQGGGRSTEGRSTGVQSKVRRAPQGDCHSRRAPSR